MVSKKQLAQIDVIENMDKNADILANLSHIEKNTNPINQQLNVDNVFESMLKVDSENAQQKIVNEIVNDKNLELKTEISHVSETTILSVFQNHLDENKLAKSSKTLKDYLTTLFRFSISKNRKSRDELIRMVEALSKSIQNEQNNSKINLIN